MEKLSRVKKYEELRKSIEITHDDQNNQLESQYAKGLNDINPSLFKRMEIKEEEPYKPEREKTNTAHILENEKVTNNFQNEYLDDFINEVRAYNLKKGTRECEDTQIDILHQLQGNNRQRRANYIEDIKDNDTKEIEEIANRMSSEDIAKEVRNLLDKSIHSFEDSNDITQELIMNDDNEKKVYAQMPIQKTQSIEEETEFYSSSNIPQEESDSIPLSKPEQLANTKIVPDLGLYQEQIKREQIDQSEEERERMLHQKLIEETQQLRIKLNDHEDTLHEYEENLTDLTDDMEKTHKILNVVLCFLILALLTLIGIVIVWLFKGGGAF